MGKIVAIIESAGEFNDPKSGKVVNYDNIIIQHQNLDRTTTYGIFVDTVKLTRETLEKILKNTNKKINEVTNIKEVYYDVKGKVTFISFE